MKKPKVSKKSTLPADFSIDNVAQTVISEETKDTPPSSLRVSPPMAEEDKVDVAIHIDGQTPLPVPEIDKDAALKIEEQEMMPEELPEEEKKGKHIFILGSVAAIIVIALAVFLSFLYLKAPEQPTKTALEVSPAPRVTETPTPTMPNSAITFEILNGSGISGLAAKYGKQLETLGFKINELGNAEGSPIGLAIYISASLDSQKDAIIASIKEELPKASYSGVLVGSSNMVRLIIGK